MVSETQASLKTSKPIDRVLSLVPTKRYSKGYLAHQDKEEISTIWEDEMDEPVDRFSLVGEPAGLNIQLYSIQMGG